MQISIIGAGHVGGALGTGWTRTGHDVTYIARENIAAARTADVIVLAVPWNAVQAVLQGAGALEGKIVLDCTNGWPADAKSGGERVAALAVGARVVKIFNNTGAASLENPLYGTEKVTMFYAGDDAEAKNTAARLAADLGLDPVDAGPLANARHLEALAMLLVTLAYGQKMGAGIAFRLLRR